MTSHTRNTCVVEVNTRQWVAFQTVSRTGQAAPTAFDVVGVTGQTLRSREAGGTSLLALKTLVPRLACVVPILTNSTADWVIAVVALNTLWNGRVAGQTNISSEDEVRNTRGAHIVIQLAGLARARAGQALLPSWVVASDTAQTYTIVLASFTGVFAG